ncbi:MAG: hypothetical protein FJX02_09270 [Alphaproteobacteria bacterium]|nr:hypothetical protein [Alphaproteobacteria bacterium]
MSLNLYAFLKSPVDVSRADLAEALAAVGFPAVVPHELSEADGYWPVEFAERHCGVQMVISDTVEGALADDPEILGRLGGRDRHVLFWWSSLAQEGGAAYAIAAALIRRCDVLVYDPEEGGWMDLEGCRKVAREMFDWAREENEPENRPDADDA